MCVCVGGGSPLQSAGGQHVVCARRLARHLRPSRSQRQMGSSYRVQSFLLLSTSGRAGCLPRGWTSASLDLILPLLGHPEAQEGQSKEGCPDVISHAYQGLWFGAPQVPGGTCPARSRPRGPSFPLPWSREDERKVSTSRGTSGGP